MSKLHHINYIHWKTELHHPQPHRKKTQEHNFTKPHTYVAKTKEQNFPSCTCLWDASQTAFSGHLLSSNTGQKS